MSGIGEGGMVPTTATIGARTPEELETLFEDALVVGDRAALGDLFEAGAVLLVGGVRPARGEAISRIALTAWGAGEDTATATAYLADPRRVVQAHDVALIVAERGVNVARRGSDGAWRYAIVAQSGDDGWTEEP